MQNRLDSVTRRPIRRRKQKKALRRVAVLAVLALAAIVAVGIGFTFFRSPVVRTMVRDRIAGKWEPKDAFPGRDQVTVMILGRDLDRDKHDRVLKTKGRTDSIMVARLDFAHKTANILSIPRDTRVRIPGHRGQHKINSAHAYGGPELTAKTIENFIGIEPEEYVVVDYSSFETAIDQIGRLSINVDKQMDYDDNWGGLHIHLKPGPQSLSGKDALGYVRYRKSNDGQADTDQDRIARQQQFLFALKQRLVSPSAFFKLPDVIGTVRGGVNSSLTDAQLMCVAQFIKGLPSTSVHAATLPSTPGGVYLTADDSEARELVRRMFN